ncbi:MAG: 3-dehydroquinate synthase [Gammaproteobacteria bacterium]|nr:3-dehydroquinate synthase [Gammaproteobacteria bacterium]
MRQAPILNVELGERSYPIIIGSGLLGAEDLGSYVKGDDCLVVSNETVAPLYLDLLQKSLAGKRVLSVELPDGEAYKTMDSVRLVIDALVDGKANRDATVLALGGGVVGDIAGFAAACYMRGISFIQVPTTLLAQVDSSVGGKTGVNHEGGKNLIGAFHQPSVVMIDTDTLMTLPDREFSAGMAEVIKHAAIADPAYFAWLETEMPRLMQRDAAPLGEAVRRSCEIKAQVVAEDEREHGRRAILNFGHTFGHAIENSMGYGEWLHGEAVAAGMVMAARLSGIPDGELTRLRNLLVAAGLPVKPPPIGAERLSAAMRMDKKVVAKEIRFVLLEKLGSAVVSAAYDRQRLAEVLAGAGDAA